MSREGEDQIQFTQKECVYQQSIKKQWWSSKTAPKNTKQSFLDWQRDLHWRIVVVQQSSEGSHSLYMSGLSLRADCQWHTLFSPFDNVANTAPVLVQALSAVQTLMLAMVALQQPKYCYTLCVSRGRTELPLAIVTLGTIRPKDSGAAFGQKKQFSGRLDMPGVNPLDILGTLYWVSEGKHSHHHLYIIHFIIWRHCFHRLQCHINDHSAEKWCNVATYYYYYCCCMTLFLPLYYLMHQGWWQSLINLSLWESLNLSI